MPEGRVGRKLSRNKGQRKSLLVNLAQSLLKYEQIKTTKAKAKEVRRLAEKLISFAKVGNLASRRQAAKIIGDKEILHKLFTTIGPRYKDRPGGYTQIFFIGNRQGDNAPIVLIKLL